MQDSSRRPVSRRAVLSTAGVLAAAGLRPVPAEASAQARLTVLGTTDLHGNVFNWDYYNDREYDDRAGDDVGLAKIATLVDAVRAERGADKTLLIDAGDTIQGTPLAYYYARIEPIGARQTHPMAAAMNAIGYDAAALGNHEFNYGIPLLRQWQEQLDFPLLGANALDWSSSRPAFPPYVVKSVRVSTDRRPVRVGVLGLTNPGIAIWDKANVEGQLRFPGLVEQAKVWVPRLRRRVDVLLVAAHSGLGPSSSYGDAIPFPENASVLLAEEVEGIDAILVGHAHAEIAERFVTHQATGRQVLLTEPAYWGKRLSVIDLDLRWSDARGWEVDAKHSQVLNSNQVPEDPEIVRILTADHAKVVAYVNSRIGTCKEAMSAASARYEDAAAIDFVNFVQADAVKAVIEGTPEAGLPVLSIAAPFNRQAAIPAGEVSVRDVAGLYIYDNTLLAIKLTGGQLRDYLERSAEYFRQVTGTGPFTPDQLTNADGMPDYNYDIVSGLDARLTYDIDVARPAGSRITDLAYGDAPVDDAQEFVVAINNYRQAGGGNFPHVTTAPVVDNRQVETRQLIIDWVSKVGAIDPGEFAEVDWRLVANGQPVVVTP